MKNKCPTCKKVVKAPKNKTRKKENYFPFCSNRCKLIDLGAWFDANYKVISKIEDEGNEVNN